MAEKRRNPGEGSLYFDKARNRWTAEVTVGYDARGKRIVKKRRRKDKTAAKNALKDLIRSLDDGTPIESDKYTVGDAVQAWLKTGLRGRSEGTIKKNTIWANVHVIPALGRRKLRELTADDVDTWLDDLAEDLSTDSLRQVYSVLKRSVAHAQARDKVKRNVVTLCQVPTGRDGRPSKSLTLEQAERVLDAAEADDSTVGDYIVVSLTTGARTEEARELGWDLVNLEGRPDADPPIPPHIDVWRSVRVGGDTKTVKSRRTLAAPQRAVEALQRQQVRQQRQRDHQTALDRQAPPEDGTHWQDTGLVFTTRHGTRLEARNVRRAFRRIIGTAGLEPGEWTPRELRHSFVSLLSNHAGLKLEVISLLVGHAGTNVTSKVYRKELRPVMLEGAEAMDRILPSKRQGSA
ncbi:site-specific integrase [Flindersiella endophytica]